MRHSETIAKLAGALVKASAEVQHATKNATNLHFKSKYADLAEIIDTIKPVFVKHGLTVVQMPGLEDGHATVETMLLHESGEWLAGLAGAPLQKNDPQGVGSAITYLRRYALAALAGIAQEDDDGNAASHHAPRSAPASNAGSDIIPCAKCGGDMWDNRHDKPSPKSPDLKCKDKACGHAVWLKSWRDDLLRDIAAVHERGTIDAEQRARAEQAVWGMAPDKMQAVQDWVAGGKEA